VSVAFAETMTRLLAASALDAGLVREAFDSILSGEWTPVQVGAFATAVRMRGETPEAIAAAARALRAHMTPVEHGLPLVCDTCGTGGDGAHTLNVSTAAAIVVAACQVPVAKHGNRSISSRCGSADVIEALGLPIDLPAHRQAELLRDVGIAFLFAPAHHPALKHASIARRELGVRTIFNALGPIANPARATHQVIGVYDDALRPMLARVLADLGCVRAWVVRSVDGLDEMSPAAPTRISEVEGDRVTERTIDVAEFGLAPVSLETIRGGTPAENASLIEAVLGDSEHAAATAVVLNAAAMLYVCGVQKTPRDAAGAAREAIRSGAARRALDDWRDASRPTEIPPDVR
jgi:anthranilate phosphoribosyltransferase